MNKTRTSRLWSAFVCAGLLFGVVHTIRSVEYEGAMIHLPMEHAEMLLNALEYALETRAPRPGVGPASPAYPVSTSDSAELASIAECVCLIKRQLAACCSVIEDIDSKIDILITSTNSVTITTIISAIDTCCATINSNLDSCCSTIESQLGSCCSVIDVIESIVETIDNRIVPCCSVVDNINSLVDILITSTSSTIITVITSQIETCCASINSNLDVCCSTIESQLTSCCSVIEDIDSKIDILLTATVNLTPITSQLDECCSIIESQLASCCSVIEDIDSKIDILLTTTVDLSPITSQLDECCSIIEQTLGNLSDTGSCFPVITTIADIDNANLDVIQWLKTLMFELRGVC